MPNLLRGLKDRGLSPTAVVAVSDDGGSSGELRRLYRMPAPGDLRNVVVALSEADPDWLELLQFRFEDNLLEGHSLGNLVLAALTRMKDGFEPAVETLCRLAQVRGRIIPAAHSRVGLVATHADGSKTTGEVSVSVSGRPITQLALHPTPEPASGDLLAAIGEADVVVLGPGSLFTSVIPPLLVPGVAQAISSSKARIVYVANLMTQPGETTDFSLGDHVGALRRHGLERLDAVLVHEGELPASVCGAYVEHGATPVRAEDFGDGVVWSADLVAAGDKLRHDPDKLAAALLENLGAVPPDSPVEAVQAEVTVVNGNGLHTRPASQIVKIANAHDADVTITHRDQVADARSIMDLILLTATQGSRLEIRGTGPDAPLVVSTLVELINQGFQEGA